MTAFHPAYGERAPERFEGTRDELVGGELLGGTARPELMLPGDVIVFVREGDASAFHIGHYYYDPALCIDGHHFVKVSSELGSAWQRIRRSA